MKIRNIRREERIFYLYIHSDEVIRLQIIIFLLNKFIPNAHKFLRDDTYYNDIDYKIAKESCVKFFDSAGGSFILTIWNLLVFAREYKKMFRYVIYQIPGRLHLHRC